MISQIKLFYNEVQAEMKKVTWPTRKELRDSAVVVTVAVVILAIFIGVVDFFLSRFATLILR